MRPGVSSIRVLVLTLLLSFGLSGCKRRTDPGDTSQPSKLDPRRVKYTFKRKKLVFGLTPSISAQVLNVVFKPLAAHLGRELRIPVEIRVAKSYQQLSDWLVDGSVDFARLPAYSYVLTRKRYPKLQLLVRELSDGSEYYRSYIIVRRDSRITALDQLRGKRFGFVDKSSTSGYLYPAYLLLQAKISPKHDFSKILFLGNHLATIRGVLEKKVDAGAIYSSSLISARSVGLDTQQLAIIGKSARIPFDAYCASDRVPVAMANRMRAILLDLNTRTRRGARILQGVTRLNGFVSAKDKDYDDIRRLVKKVAQER